MIRKNKNSLSDDIKNDDIDNISNNDSEVLNENTKTGNSEKSKRKLPCISNYFFKVGYHKDTSVLIKIDDESILEKVLEKYPNFKYDLDVKDLKKIFLEMLDDYMFIYTLLDDKHITIKDFLATIIRNYDKIFNSIVYSRKIQEKIVKYGYDDN